VVEKWREHVDSAVRVGRRKEDDDNMWWSVTPVHPARLT
jgi:hypothetical protein